MAAAISAIVVADVITVSMVAAAVTEVGIITSVIGMITKNKTLTEIGGVMALAGGIGGLAAGAAEGIATADVVEGMDQAGLASSDIGGSVAGGDVALPTNTNMVTGNMGGSMSGGDVLLPGTDQSLVPGANSNVNLDGTTGTPGTPGTPGTSPTGTSVNPTTAAQVANTATTSAPKTPSATSATSAPPPTDTKDQGWFTKYFGSLSDGQGKALAAAMQVGGSALAGLTTGWTEEQKLAIAQQAQDLASTKYNTQVANAAGQPKITYAPVNQPAANGLVNSTPKVGV